MTNIVIRICTQCGFYGEQEKEFSYLSDDVWSCHRCCSKYTKIKEVIYPDKAVTNP